ncbi:Probable monooxygenase [Mycobacteroides abscessus subsp. abscessus]|nr:Probable monooxygenase [Mycobacteroides abscessus subsp. abscessus]
MEYTSSPSRPPPGCPRARRASRLPSDFVYEIGHYGNVSNGAYTAVEKTRSRDVRVVVIGAGFAIT